MSSTNTNGKRHMGIVTCDISVSLDGLRPANQSVEHPFGDGVEGGDTLRSLDVRGTVTITETSWPRSPTPAPSSWAATCSVPVAGLGSRLDGLVGDDPPYHAPVYVLTNHDRESVEMTGGTTFHFVTGGSEKALALAREAAEERNVAIAGGMSTVNQFLAAGAIDELRLHVAPVVVGVGYERIFDGVPPTSWSSTSGRWTPEVTHVTYRR